MKKLKVLTSVVLSAVMVFAMAGCGSKEADNVFRIGGIGPTTGGAAIYGQAVMNAAQIAVDEINAAGGINGYQVELNFQDDVHDAEKSVNAYNVLKDWNADVILGSVTSTPSIAVSEKTKADNMFQLTPSGTAAECTQYDNCFRVCFSDPNQGKESAAYIGENNLASKVAVIYDSSDVYSSGIYEAFAAEADNQSFEIVCAEAFTSESKSDFTVLIQKAMQSGADMIFLPIYYQESALILTQANTLGYEGTYFSCDGMDGILGVENFDVSLAEGVMLLSPFTANATDDLTKNFVAAYQDKYDGATPNQFAADAYDAVYIIKMAAEKAGVTPDMKVSEIGDKMKAAMTEISFSGTTGNDITWTADGEPNKAPLVLKIENGEYVIM